MRGFFVFRCLPFRLLQDGIHAGKCRIIDNIFSKALYIFNEIMLQAHIGGQFGFSWQLRCANTTTEWKRLSGCLKSRDKALICP